MPQLDTVYILMTYLWTWAMLHLMTQKIKTILMTTNPTIDTPNKPTLTLLWL
uniref:ATPase 8 n=1 Tax=Pituophis deppei deppei TaxID=1073926 RepID=G0ZM82_9SAUR|nr:ATPase 8 [Pituophis deppei deppei]AEM53560.1 ATPase 8 [Pituophis deppei deppei]AEM53562.1 ATPase 8 [Pituophis deppei deppei]AEM53564.1 ATPase 8 [Pituophis deppei deppei]AEM53565.1 ATPase 8 [Pituophis deppei deppei]